jgi:CMP/dCMP kinase
MTVVTISRQYASGGDEIAARACDLLAYRYFDKRLMAEVAAQAGPPAGEVVDYHEDDYKMLGFLDRLLGRTPPRPVKTVSAWTETRHGVKTREVAELDEQAAITLVQAAIRAAYELGKVVIVGRGGQAILKDKPGVLHVRIEAPMEARVKRLRDVAEFTVAAAQEEILDHDKAAADYIKRFYGVNWSDPALYHMVINAGKLDTEKAARLVVAAVACLESGARA